MSDWDDLFALASGREESKTCKQNRREIKSDELESATNRRKKKLRKNPTSKTTIKNTSSVSHIPHIDDGDFCTMLKSRLDPIEKQIDNWPPWSFLGSSLVDESSSACKQWKESSSTSRVRPSSETRRRNCATCSLNPLHHSLEINDALLDHNSESAYLISFALIRDIRCCCSSIFSSESTSSPPTSQELNAFASNAVLKARKLIRILSSAPKLPDGEAEILDEKFRRVLSSAQLWYDKMKRFHGSNNGDRRGECKYDGIFDEMTNLIVECDYAYYRLYYLQITGLLPPLSIDGKLAYIPHPPTYFGVDYLSWDAVEGQQQKMLLLKDINHRYSVDVIDTSNNTNPNQLNDILRHFGLFNDNSGKSRPDHDLDPLSFLHGNRFNETLLIFWTSGWVHSNVGCSQMMTALEQTSNKKGPSAFYEKHETPAPLTLMRWRDSSRDLLCNLFAYATLPPKNFHDAISLLQQHGIHGIVELGSGTGYIAKLFQQCGISVSAFDVVPTDSDHKSANGTLNEYHGCTPAYLPVVKGDVQKLSSTSYNGYKVKQTALLLCYPPPGSRMAHDAARAFVSSGGSCIIHIGEFRGLTGTIPFETYLRNEFQLVSREPCLQWGTDAAEMTIWTQSNAFKKKPGVQGHANGVLLIPCSNCCRVEAKKAMSFITLVGIL